MLVLKLSHRPAAWLLFLHCLDKSICQMNSCKWNCSLTDNPNPDSDWLCNWFNPDPGQNQYRSGRPSASRPISQSANQPVSQSASQPISQSAQVWDTFNQPQMFSSFSFPHLLPLYLSLHLCSLSLWLYLSPRSRTCIAGTSTMTLFCNSQLIVFFVARW